jgi:hypothetical protein
MSQARPGGMHVFRRVVVDRLVDPRLESQPPPSGTWRRRQASKFFTTETRRQGEARILAHGAEASDHTPHEVPSSPSPCFSVPASLLLRGKKLTFLYKDRVPGSISRLPRPCRIMLRECRRAWREPIREHHPVFDEITHHPRFCINSNRTLRSPLAISRWPADNEMSLRRKVVD